MIQRYRVWWDRFFRQECFDKDTHGDWVRHEDIAPDLAQMQRRVEEMETRIRHIHQCATNRRHPYTALDEIAELCAPDAPSLESQS